MTRIIDAILEGNASKVKELVEERMYELSLELTDSLRMKICEEFFEGEVEQLDEATRNVIKMGTTKMIRVRIRKGKVQRKKKFSNQKGYTIRGGKVTRMSSMERRNRKIGARIGKLKRRAKLGQALRKRRVSLRKRRSMGL
jgi:hypothetical protein